MPAAAASAAAALPTELGLRAATSLLGRDDDVASVEELLARGRLATVSGPPGVGKTRLAVELLVRLRRPFAGGAFCDMTNVVDVEAMLHVVARALDVTLTSSRSRDDSFGLLAAALEARGRTLVVLDNFDEALDAARSLVCDLLLRAPGVSFLVTSRARLSLATERVHVLPPLATTEEDGSRVPPAVRLFLDRAGQVSSERWDDPTTLENVRAIVLALDGLPLAIELAAARTSLLTPREILERIHEPLALLEGPGRSLRASIEASWRLLSAAERSALAACSVMEGPFGVELAEEACRALGVDAPVTTLQGLRERSLLQLVGGDSPGERRLRVFESVRAFVAEATDEAERRRALGAATAAGRVVARRCLDAAWGKNAPATLGALLREEKAFDGLVASLIALPRRDEATTPAMFELASALVHLREEMGPADTLPAFVRSVLAAAAGGGEGRGKGTAGAARAEFEARAAGVLHRAGDRERGRLLSERAAAAARAAGAPRAEAMALLARAYGARVFDERDELHAALARARALAVEHGDGAVGATVERLQADWCQATLDPDGALSAIERAVQWAKACGDARIESRSRLTWAVLLADRGDTTAAREMALTMRDACEAAGDRKGVAFANVVAGACALELGHHEDADAFLAAGIEHGRRIGMPRLVAYALGFRAVSLGDQREFERAERALADAEELLGPSADRQRVAAVRTARAVLLARMGRLDDARRIVRSERTSASGRDGLLVRVLLGGVAIAEGARMLDEGDEAAARAKFADVAASFDALKREAAARSNNGRPPSAVLRVALRLGEQLLAAYLPPEGSLVLYERARRIALPGGEAVPLAGNALMWRFVEALTESHLRAPGRPMSREELVGRLWPGESILAHAAKNRFAVTLHKLRKLGLEPWIVTTEAGTALRPDARVVWAAIEPRSTPAPIRELASSRRAR